MAAEAGINAASATLTTTTVDTITLTGRGTYLSVVNREPTTGTLFWCTTSIASGTAATPTAAGDECFPVFPSSATGFRVRSSSAASGGAGLVVKILGNGHQYTVMLTDTPGT
jgi:hypothetical protein